MYYICPPYCECSSGVEHHLAKVRVVGSNPITRSKPSLLIEGFFIRNANWSNAQVVELVDTLDLKSNGQ